MPLSLPALAIAAERHVRKHGPTDPADLAACLATLDAIQHDRAEAGVRLAVISGRLTLDRDGTLRVLGTKGGTDRAA